MKSFCTMPAALLTSLSLVNVAAPVASGDEPAVGAFEVGSDALPGNAQRTPVLVLVGEGEECVGDVVPNGQVGFEDLIVVLAQWGECEAPKGVCLADVDDDGEVSFTDLLFVLDRWGPCP